MWDNFGFFSRELIKGTWVWCDAEERICQALVTCCTSTYEYQGEVSFTFCKTTWNLPVSHINCVNVEKLLEESEGPKVGGGCLPALILHQPGCVSARGGRIWWHHCWEFCHRSSSFLKIVSKVLAIGWRRKLAKMSHLSFVVSLGELELILAQVKDGVVWTRHPDFCGNSLKHKIQTSSGENVFPKNCVFMKKNSLLGV